MDYVYYNSLVFNSLDKGTKNIKLVIDDIYKGTKYDDTCITAVVAHDGYYRDEKDPDAMLKAAVDIFMNYEKMD
jgi:hypothetical protein